MSETADPPRSARRRLLKLPRVPRVSWRDLAVTLGPVLLLSVLAIVAAMHFVRPAPPSTLTIASGPDGSNFRTVAEKYRAILQRNGIKLVVLPTQGSQDNLNRLVDPAANVDIALVQSGVTTTGDSGDVVSLGSMYYQLLTVFYRSPKPLALLSGLQGKRIAIGAEGSGTRFLALALLKANGIEPGGGTQLLDLEGEPARKALLAQQADAIFLTGDSTGPATVREMLHEPGIRLYDFGQGDAYVRRFRYLNKLQIPAGAFDLGDNLPAAQVTMLAPTVELLAHSDLHPALSDLLIETAREVHGKATLLQNPGEFPAPLQHDYPISDDAARYYKSGKSTAYRYLPFWLASLVNRAAVVLVPIVVVLIPGLRIVPQLYGWRINNRINKRYGELMALERASLEPMTPEQRAALVEIEKSIIGVKMPSSYANQIYILRRHIKFVRGQLAPQGAALEHEPPGDEVGLILD
ncbi:MAG: TAXI family TRAP transporter solute-binding subunit [Nevskia sp.]|nr:TAXI family TRAP transporter solute-binding subunit [Nevskia sp.]